MIDRREPEGPFGKRFARRVEDFECQRCGAAVRGGGYTNHCPACLWSRHVDVLPGDRRAECGALMEPVGLESAGGREWIVHRCTACGLERRNRRAAADDFESALAVARRRAREGG